MGFLVAIQKAGKLDDLRTFLQGSLSTPAARRKYLVFLDQFHAGNPHFFPCLESLHKDEAMAFTSKATRGFAAIVDLMSLIPPDAERGTPEESEYLVCQLAGAPIEGDPKATDPPSDLAGTADELKKRAAAKKREEKKAQADPAVIPSAAVEDEVEAESAPTRSLPDPLPDSAFQAESLPLFPEPQAAAQETKPDGKEESEDVGVAAEPSPLPVVKRSPGRPRKRSSLLVLPTAGSADSAEGSPAAAPESPAAPESNVQPALPPTSAVVEPQSVESPARSDAGVPAEAPSVGPTVPVPPQPPSPASSNEPDRASPPPPSRSSRTKKSTASVMENLWGPTPAASKESHETGTSEEPSEEIQATLYEAQVSSGDFVDRLGDLSLGLADVVTSFDKAWRESNLGESLSKFFNTFGQSLLRSGLEDEDDDDASA